MRLKFSLFIDLSSLISASSRQPLRLKVGLALLSATAKSLQLNVMLISSTLLLLAYDFLSPSLLPSPTFSSSLGVLILETMSRECTLASLDISSLSNFLRDFGLSRGDEIRMISFSIGFSGESLCS
jgi:hypothetical protein